MDHTAVLTFYKEVASRLHSGIDESSVVNAYYADSSRLQSRLEKNMKHGTFTFSGTWMNPTFRLLDDSEVSDLQAKSVRMYSQIPDPETARVVKFTLDAYSNQRHKATVILYFLVGIEAANNTLQIRLFAENFDDLKEALQRSSNRGKKATLKNILGAYSIPKQN